MNRIAVLDWGGHDGVLAQLLYDAGATNITVYDVGEALPPFNFDRFPSLRHVKTAHSTDTVVLPFSDDEFDVVLSVGVLEHVPFMADSLKELHRVLKSKGSLFVFHFPNRFHGRNGWHLGTRPRAMHVN